MAKSGLIAAALHIAALVGSVLVMPESGTAAVEGRACEAEPTDQQIRYGDLITCASTRLATATASGSPAEAVKRSRSKSPEWTAVVDAFSCSTRMADLSMFKDAATAA